MRTRLRIDEKDPNERFVLRHCLTYISRILQKYRTIDEELLDLLALLDEEGCFFIGQYVSERMNEKDSYALQREIQECAIEPDDYGKTLFRAIKQAPARIMPGLCDMIEHMLQQKISMLAARRISGIEKNIAKLREMFGLSFDETEFCTFLYVVNTHGAIRHYFEDHLTCGAGIGRKYLMTALNFNRGRLADTLAGNLAKIEMFHLDMNFVKLDEEYHEFIENASRAGFHDKFFTPACKEVIPVEYHFVDTDKSRYVLDLLRNAHDSSTHILLYGPPGTGKTSYAHGIARQTDRKTYEIIRGDENKTLQRRTAIMACLNMTNKQKGPLIIVDEADNILNTESAWFRRGETQDKGWLNQLMEEPGATMIWITNTIDSIEDSVLRRFAYSLYFPEFNQKQRARLWNTILRKNRVKRFFQSSDIDRLAKHYPMSAGIIDLAVKTATQTNTQTKTDLHKAITMALNAHLTLKNSGRQPVVKDNIEKSYSIEGLNTNGDIDAMMHQLKRFDRHLRNPDTGFHANMNLLFYGQPGTGKSELARYLAEALERKMLTRRASDILDKYVGQSEKNISRMFAEAEHSHAVLIIDEIDSLLFSRDMAQRSWEFSQTNEFLSQMERFRGILIGTTNVLDRLDQASIRRFNHKIGFNCLTPEGNCIFYDRLLQPLMKEALPEDAESALKKISDLAPGDFRLVRDRFCFYPKHELSHTLLINALCQESQVKNLHKGRKRIGF